MRRMTIVALALVGGVGAAACGDDGGTSASGEERAAYVDAIDEAGRDENLSDEENRCVAEAYVDGIGLDELRDAVTPDEIRDRPDADPRDYGIELDEARATLLYEGMSRCVDVRQLIIDDLVADEGISDEARACIEDGFDEDLVRDMMVLVLTEGDAALDQDSELADRFVEMLTPCALIDAQG